MVIATSHCYSQDGECVWSLQWQTKSVSWGCKTKISTSASFSPACYTKLAICHLTYKNWWSFYHSFCACLLFDCANLLRLSTEVNYYVWCPFVATVHQVWHNLVFVCLYLEISSIHAHKMNYFDLYVQYVGLPHLHKECSLQQFIASYLLVEKQVADIVYTVLTPIVFNFSDNNTSPIERKYVPSRCKICQRTRLSNVD